MIQRLLLLLLLPAIVILGWQAATGGIITGFQPLDPVLIGRPDRIATELWDLVSSGRVWPHLRTTLTEAFLGLLIAIGLGTAAGILVASNQSVEKISLPYVNVANSVPKLALAPFFLIWFGIGITSKILMSAAAAFFPVFFTTYHGVRNIDRDLLNAVRIMGAGRIQLLRIVILPSVLSWTAAGIRTSLGLAVVGAVVGEYLGSTQGLGYLLLAAQGVLNTDLAWAVLVVLAGIGALFDGLSRLIESRLLAWRVARD